MPIVKGGHRSYGPGKFEGSGEIGSLINDLGTDEDLGDSETFGWYGLLRDGESILAQLLESGAEVTEEEAENLRTSAGVILHEDSQGFVDVDYYDTEDELEEAWSDLEDEYSEFAEDEDLE